jgi:hypothetical protein
MSPTARQTLILSRDDAILARQAAEAAARRWKSDCSPPLQRQMEAHRQSYSRITSAEFNIARRAAVQQVAAATAVQQVTAAVEGRH